MKTYPAIALIEVNNIATGIKVGDAVAKKAPIGLLKTGTVSHGKYLILIGGTVAAVDESYHEGVRVAAESLLDSMILPDVHPRVVEAVLGETRKIAAEALGVLETGSIAVNIEAADAAIKGARVEILEMRLGDAFGGKGYTLFNGRVEDVEAAIRIACDITQARGVKPCISIIPRLHEGMIEQINSAQRFSQSKQSLLKDGEKDVTG